MQQISFIRVPYVQCIRIKLQNVSFSIAIHTFWNICELIVSNIFPQPKFILQTLKFLKNVIRELESAVLNWSRSLNSSLPNYANCIQWNIQLLCTRAHNPITRYYALLLCTHMMFPISCTLVYKKIACLENYELYQLACIINRYPRFLLHYLSSKSAVKVKTTCSYPMFPSITLPTLNEVLTTYTYSTKYYNC